MFDSRSARYRRVQAYAYLRSIAGCILLHVCRIIFNRCLIPALRGIAGFKLMPICAVSQAAYCFTFAELVLIVVRLPLCAVSQGSSLCLSARYRRLHMLHVCRIIFNRCLIPALRGIAGFKLMPICAVSQAAYCFTFAELVLIVVRLPLCAVSQGSSLCLSARYRRLHMLHVCRIIFNRCLIPALRGIAGFKLMPICAVSQAAYASRLPNYL